jgi:hypothetical protein
MNKPTDHLPIHEYTSGVREVDAKTRYRIKESESGVLPFLLGALSAVVFMFAIFAAVKWLK